MELYKLGALNKYFQRKNLRYRLPVQTSSHDILFIADTAVYVRLAKTSEQLRVGLMGVTHLDPTEGCLFDFGSEQYVTLWMKNCKMNLQAAMIDRDGLIVDIKDMLHAHPNVLHSSSRPVRYALEMPEKFFTSLGIKVGQRVRF